MKEALTGPKHVKSLKNKYLSLFIATVLILCSFGSYAQLPSRDTTRDLKYIEAEGYSWRNGQFLVSLRLARDTPQLALRDSGAIAYKGGNLWTWDGVYWNQKSSATVTGGGPGVDSVIVSDIGRVCVYSFHGASTRCFELDKFIVHIGDNYDSTAWVGYNYMGDAVDSTDRNLILVFTRDGIDHTDSTVTRNGKQRRGIVFFSTGIVSGSVLDTAIRFPVLDSLNTPVVSPGVNDAWLVGTNPTGGGNPWVGHANNIAKWNGSIYIYDTATVGDLIYRVSNQMVSKFNGTAWIRIGKLLLHPGGDAYGIALNIGTTDNHSVQIIANKLPRIIIGSTGPITIPNLAGSGNGLVGLTSGGLLNRINPGSNGDVLTILSGVPAWQASSPGGGQADSAYFWQKTGNATIYGNFIGTTNNNSLFFKTRNILRAYIDSASGNFISKSGLWAVDGAIKIYSNSGTQTIDVSNNLSIILDNNYGQGLRMNSTDIKLQHTGNIEISPSNTGSQGTNQFPFTFKSLNDTSIIEVGDAATGNVARFSKFRGKNITDGFGQAMNLVFYGGTELGTGNKGSVILAHDGSSPSGNVNVGTITTVPTAILNVQSTTKGALFSPMIAANRIAISSPANGLLVYDLDSLSYFYFNNTSWVNLKSAGGGSGLTSSSFIVGETPSGSINSSNLVFTLTNTPVTNKEIVYLNGIRQKRGTDYTISTSTITFIVAPTSGDELLSDYIK